MASIIPIVSRRRAALDKPSCRAAVAPDWVREPLVSSRMIAAGIVALIQCEGDGDCAALVSQIYLAMRRLSAESDEPDTKDDQPAS